jgi:tRNA A37 threonylcarbamoyladenosine synthetase subunit TsaC/SUA5/YrdC
LKDQKDLIVLDGGVCPIGVESTIVDLVHNRITRIGAVAAEAIEKEIGRL